MPGKACQIVRRNIIAEIVQQQERIEVLGIPETKCTAEMNPRSFKSWFGFDKPLDWS